MELRQYMKIVLRWWWLILLSTSIAAGASYIASIQQPRVYQASTTLMVGQVIHKANPTGQDFFTTERLAQSYAQMAGRQPILQATIDGLGLETSWQGLQGQVYAQQIQGTQLLEISVLDNSPEYARVIADEVGHQLILQSPTSPENKARQERGAFVQSQLDDLEARIEIAQNRVKEMEAELATALSARQIQDLQTEIANLESLITNWQANYAELLSFLEGGNTPNYLTVIEPAQLPTRPISPNVKLNVLLAAAVGLVLALGAALLLEYIDDTIKSPDDLSESLGLTTLGAISRIEGRGYEDKLITSGNPFSPVTEAYRMIRSNVQFTTVDRPAKSIMITSPNPAEGKSTTAANLGVVMAQADLKTVIIDADLRRPMIHKIFGVPNLDGLTDLLRSPKFEINGQLLKDTAIENLHVITSGPLPPNPSEMLGSQRMAQLLTRLEEIADVIILDSPPALAVSDAAALSNRVDGVILVTQAGRTRRDVTRRAIKSLHQVGANILGGILNGVSGRRGGYYYQYNYYYSHNGQGPENRSDRAGRRLDWQAILPPSLRS